MAMREENIKVVVDHLQIKKTTLVEAHELYDNVAKSAFNEVTITGTSFEGGGGSGQIAFPRADYLAGIQTYIRAIDPDLPPPIRPSVVAYSNYSQRAVEA